MDDEQRQAGVRELDRDFDMSRISRKATSHRRPKLLPKSISRESNRQGSRPSEDSSSAV
jgi:hypothetical protein